MIKATMNLLSPYTFIVLSNSGYTASNVPFYLSLLLTALGIH
ncbi:MAG TPA: hypothetical protein PLF27_01285 [Sedimentibacter sp.]|nr:hypothetical protein [Sedimentibacter sp.]